MSEKKENVRLNWQNEKNFAERMQVHFLQV